jgi:hypothetical protein
MTQRKTWSDIHQKRYVWLYNWLKSDQDLIKIPMDINVGNYLKRLTITTLVKAIQKNKSWGSSSKEGIFFMIARWFEVNDLTPNNEIDYIKKLGFDIKTKRDEEEGENKLDEKEQEHYRDHEYFIKILNDIDPHKLNSSPQASLGMAEHLKYLLLMLLVKQPPVRTNFYISAKFATKPSDINDDDNYIYLKTIAGKDKAFYVINKDKVSNTRTYKDNTDLSYIDIADNDLVKLLYDSYEKYKRKYLFESTGKPITDNTLLKYLRDITKVSGITIDIMRSSYITNHYENNRTYKSRDQLAKQMRHSQLTATKNYNKVLGPTPDDVVALRNENKQLKEKIKELHKIIQM